MKVAVYARVSDDKKKDDGERRQDVNRQIALLMSYWEAQGVPTNEIMIYQDDGKSAFTEDWNSRPDFKHMMNDCRRHFITHIVIEDMTRLSRRIDLGLPILRELGELNVQLISLREGEIEVTSANSWLKSTMLLMFAEWDSRVKSEKVKSGMKKARDQGKKIGGFRQTPPASVNSGEKETLPGASLK